MNKKRCVRTIFLYSMKIKKNEYHAQKYRELSKRLF